MQQQHIKKKNKHKIQPQYQNLTPFKQIQKHFKLYQHKQTDFSILYQPQQYQEIMGYRVAFLPFPQGAILVKKFNPQEVVVQIAAQALNVYFQKPFRTNLNSRQEMYKQQKQQKQETKLVQQHIPIQKQQQNLNYYFNQKIRWANVGYQYDWTERKYPKMKTVFPQQISSLCERANILYNSIKNSNKVYHPQSAIINYYGEKDYMTGHLDDAQIDQHSPIYSFSFGLSCVFVIGGRTKEDKPISIRLDSGDLVIMGGQSRLCYHGVPRVIKDSFNPLQKIQIKIQNEWRNKSNQIYNYLKTHRININVRQVYPTQ